MTWKTWIIDLMQTVESKTNKLYVNNIWILLETYFLDSVDNVVKYSQNPLFLTFFNGLHSHTCTQMFFQYFLHADNW